MIAGHFGFAAIVKSREPATPLWILMLASVWLDIIFVPLFLAGIETIIPVPGHTGYGAAIIHADYTHSVVGAIVISALLLAVTWPVWGKRSAIVIGLVAFSHWVLDLLVHRADMPILPGNAFQLPRLGLGIWQFPVASAAIELALILAGAWCYGRAARNVCRENHRSTRFATVLSVLLGGVGILILALDVTS